MEINDELQAPGYFTACTHRMAGHMGPSVGLDGREISMPIIGENL